MMKKISQNLIEFKMKLIDIKLELLMKGIDVDFDSFSKFLAGKEKNYKINRLKVSDRHFLGPKDERRKFIPDELIIKNGTEKAVAKTYYNPQSEIKLKNNLEIFDLFLKMIFVK